MDMRQNLINHITKNKEYLNLCKKVNSIYYEDVFQDVAIVLLTIADDKLPQPSYFNFWFYRVAKNINLNSQRGKIVTIQLNEIEHEVIEEQSLTFDELKEAESVMLDLPEFDNRVLHLYTELGNMKKVQKATGISYAALRRVKDKLK